MFQTNDSKKLGLPEVYGGPGQFRKVREACRNNYHLISCAIDLIVKSYDRENDFLHEYLVTNELQFANTRQCISKPCNSWIRWCALAVKASESCRNTVFHEEEPRTTKWSNNKQDTTGTSEKSRVLNFFELIEFLPPRCFFLLIEPKLTPSGLGVCYMAS